MRKLTILKDRFYQSFHTASAYITESSIYKTACNLIDRVDGRIDNFIKRHPRKAAITAIALIALTISLFVVETYFKWPTFYAASNTAGCITGIFLKRLVAYKVKKTFKEDSILTACNNPHLPKETRHLGAENSSSRYNVPEEEPEERKFVY